MEKRVSFSWDLHWSCNYRCPYCWWHGRWENLAERNTYPGTERIISIWSRLFDKYGQVHISMAGGEPMTYPDFPRILGRMLDFHTVDVATNMSGDAAAVAAEIRPEHVSRLRMHATYHPLFAELEPVMEKVRIFKDKGIFAAISVLAYPEYIERIPEISARVQEEDIAFSVLTFWGEYEGREYPSAYSERELKIINPELGDRNGEQFQTEPLLTRGRLCNAGHLYGVIHPDGMVLPCGGGAWKGKNRFIGNIFDKDFDLWKGPERCPSEHCPCNEWAFLLCEDE